jgi:hypothetical protein
MLHDELWQRAVPEDTDAPGMSIFLCVGCLERRLGRRLTPADLKAVGISELNAIDSDRLADRKGHR